MNLTRMFTFGQDYGRSPRRYSKSKESPGHLKPSDQFCEVNDLDYLAQKNRDVVTSVQSAESYVLQASERFQLGLKALESITTEE